NGHAMDSGPRDSYILLARPRVKLFLVRAKGAIFIRRAADFGWYRLANAPREPDVVKQAQEECEHQGIRDNPTDCLAQFVAKPVEHEGFHRQAYREDNRDASPH